MKHSNFLHLLFWKLLQATLSLSLATWRLERSARSPSSEAPSNSRVRWWKHNITRMSGQWKLEIKANWPLKDFRNGTTGFLLSGKRIFFFLLLLFFSFSLLLIITMCEGWIWVRRQFIFVMDTRTGKLSAWFIGKTDLINVILEPGGRTMAKRTGLLFPLLYFMAEFWLTSQQVLRIGECCFLCFFLPPMKRTKLPHLKSLQISIWTEQTHFLCLPKRNKKQKDLFI